MKVVPSVGDVRVTAVSYGVGCVWRVTPVWAGVDLTDGAAWQVPDRGLAERLARGLRRGLVWRNARVETTRHGQTWVRCEMLIRTGADLAGQLAALGC